MLIALQTKLSQMTLSERILGKVMAPKDVDALVSKTCDYAALRGNRDSADYKVNLIMGKEAGFTWVDPM